MLFLYFPVDGRPHEVLADYMNHCQEYHPATEFGPALWPGSANCLRKSLGIHLCYFPDKVADILETGSWLAKNYPLGRVVVLFYPKSSEKPTAGNPGLLTIKVPDLMPPQPLAG